MKKLCASFLACMLAFTLNAQEAGDSSLIEDDPIAACLDSSWAAFCLLNNRTVEEDVVLDSVTPISDALFKERMALLDQETPVELLYNKIVKQYINLYVERRRQQTSAMLKMSELYFPIFEEVLDQYNLPYELKYLPIIESALHPRARSRAGAVGYWQIIYPTAKMLKLKINSYIDERSDVYKSTDAACRYLKSLFEMYGNWELALAAYNSGPGNVNKAIRRSGGKQTYWEIRPFLPRETRGYVPAFIAVNYTMNYAAEHGIVPDAIDLIEQDTVHVKKNLSFHVLAKELDVDKAVLRQLNPCYTKDFVPGNAKLHQTLILPEDKVALFVNLEDSLYKSETAKKVDYAAVIKKQEQTIYHRVRSGEYLGKIAEKYGCRVSDIKRWNNLKSNRININQRLVIYGNKRGSSISTKPQKSKVKQTETSGDYVYYTVKEGDNLWDIAQGINGLSVEDIKRLNPGISHKRLRIGQKLKVGKRS